MPLPWKSICAPTDFSDASRPAFRLAIDLAMHFDAELSVIYVQELPPLVYFGGPVPQTILDDLDAQARESLDAWHREAKERGAKRAVSAMLTGVSFDAIVGYARVHHTDLIVMGTHGRTAFKRALIGSVAEKVVRHASCPVLTVHPGEGSLPGK